MNAVWRYLHTHFSDYNATISNKTLFVYVDVKGKLVQVLSWQQKV